MAYFSFVKTVIKIGFQQNIKIIPIFFAYT